MTFVRKFDFPSYMVSNFVPSKIRSDFLTINWFNIELNRVIQGTRESSLVLGKL